MTAFSVGDPLPDQGEFLRISLIKLPKAFLNCPEFPFLLAIAVVGTVKLVVQQWHQTVNQEKHLSLARGQSFLMKLESLLPKPDILLFSWIYLVVLANAIYYWIFLPRYLTGVLPFLYLILAHTILAWPRWAHIGRILLILSIAFNLVNARGELLPSVESVESGFQSYAGFFGRSCMFTERSLEYLDDLRSTQAAMTMLAREHQDDPIFAELPYAWYLTKWRLGYVPTKLTDIVMVEHFGDGVQQFVKKVLAAQNGDGKYPIFIYMGRARANLPPPDARQFEVIYKDSLQPSLIITRVRPEVLPRTAEGLEEWYLDATWGDDFMAQRALERSYYLVKTGRRQRSIREFKEAIAKGDNLLGAFLKQRLEQLQAEEALAPSQ